MNRLLAEVFSGVFHRQVDVSQPLTRDAVSDWDSLKHMEIVFSIEAATRVTFSEEEIVAIRSIDDLRRKLSANNAA